MKHIHLRLSPEQRRGVTPAAAVLHINEASFMRLAIDREIARLMTSDRQFAKALCDRVTHSDVVHTRSECATA